MKMHGECQDGAWEILDRFHGEMTDPRFIASQVVGGPTVERATMAARHQRTASTTTDESVPSTSSGGVPMGKGPTAQGLMFTPRGTVAGWYTEDYTFDAADPGPSSSTYGAYPSPAIQTRKRRH